MHVVDWLIVAGLLFFLIVVAFLSRFLIKNVTDFLVAGRNARRYLLAVAHETAGTGAITVVALFELYYRTGFTGIWWGLLLPIMYFLISISGWVLYRFRETRALTMAQFLEMRYSRRFRVFAGIMSFVSGIINYGIFPSIAARFFLYFCQLPSSVNIAGINVDMYPLLLLAIIGISLFFTFTSGQIAVMLTDFFQGLFVNIMLVVIVIVAFFIFDWSEVMQVLAKAPAEESMLNPFKTSNMEDFSIWYYVMYSFGIFYGYLSFQGSQGYNSAAKNPHEARMGKILGSWRYFVLFFLLVILSVSAYVVLHDPQFGTQAEAARNLLDRISTDPKDTIRVQMTVPLVLRSLLPVGLVGSFCAVMLAAAISTNDTYLHSWGSIFIQDVIMPFRKKPFKPKQHMMVLRLSIVGVAIFVFFFSLLFRQTEYIFMFLVATGAIYVGGAGACIIGGLYWKKGTVTAAWAAMITGSTLAIAGFTMNVLDVDFIFNGMQVKTIACVVALITYIIVSLATSKEDFNMDKLLHRGRYSTSGDDTKKEQKPVRGLRAVIGMGAEFSCLDKVIYIGSIGWTLLWSCILIFGTVYHGVFGITDAFWIKVWPHYIWLSVIFSVFVIIWFAIGGFYDLRYFISQLLTMKRDDSDDGWVEKRESK
jgi:SSS family solute:Na+ symporter